MTTGPRKRADNSPPPPHYTFLHSNTFQHLTSLSRFLEPRCSSVHNLCQTLEPSKSKYLTTSKVGQQDGQHLCGGRHITFVRGASETYVGAVGCWCLCAPQLALVIRPQAGRPPTPRPTPPRTPTPDDSVSSPTQPNLLLLLLRNLQKTEMYFMPLSCGPGVGFLRRARYYLSQYWLAIIQAHTQMAGTMSVGMVKEWET